MSKKLQVKFTPAFSRDLKKIERRHDRNLEELVGVIDLIAENTEDAHAQLRTHHNMHALTGKWKGRLECHVANAGGLACHLVHG